MKEELKLIIIQNMINERLIQCMLLRSGMERKDLDLLMKEIAEEAEKYFKE